MATPVDNPTPADGPANELAEMKALYSGLLKRLDSQSGIIEIMRKRLGQMDEQPATGTPAKNEGLEARVKSLEERDKALTERERRMTTRQIQQSVSRALAASGIPAVQAEDLAEVMVSRTPDKFTLNDAGNVSVVEGDGALDVKQWAGLFCETERGKAYLPQKQNPRLGLEPNKGQGTKPKRVVTRDDLRSGAVKGSELLTGDVILAD